MSSFLGVFNYLAVIIIMMMGFYITISHKNLVKKLIGLNIFQVSVFILYISFAYIDGSTPPIVSDQAAVYASPLPHVLILTAIVVGISTTALGLAIIIRIYQAFGSIDEDVIKKKIQDSM